MLCDLFHDLLTHCGLVTALDMAGETPLASVVHNHHCIENLGVLSSAAKTTLPTCHHKPRRGESPTSFPPEQAAEGGVAPISVIASYTSNESGLTATTTSATDTVTPVPDTAAAHFGIGIRMGCQPNLMPYVSLGEESSSVDLLTGNSDNLATPTDPTSQEMDTALSPTVGGGPSSDNGALPLSILRQFLPPDIARKVEEGKLKNVNSEVIGEISSHVRTAFESVAQEIEDKVLEKVKKVVTEKGLVVSSAVSKPLAQKESESSSLSSCFLYTV